jgi:hypothetical protein
MRDVLYLGILPEESAESDSYDGWIFVDIINQKLVRGPFQNELAHFFLGRPTKGLAQQHSSHEGSNACHSSVYRSAQELCPIDEEGARIRLVFKIEST